jgi:hypothetical protein
LSAQDLRQWIDWNYGDLKTASPKIQEEIRKKAVDLFRTKNPAIIDGKLRVPTHIQAQFLDLTSKGVTIIENSASIDMVSAVVGVIASYQMEEIPQSVDIKWDFFNEYTTSIPTIVIDPAGPLGASLEQDDPILSWHNYLKKYQKPLVQTVRIEGNYTMSVPLGSIVLLALAFGIAIWLAMKGGKSKVIAGIVVVIALVVSIPVSRIAVIEVQNPFFGPPKTMEATRIANEILTNVNNALTQRNKEALEASLTKVIANENFSQTAPELLRSLSIKVAGGGTALVKSIADLSISEISANIDNDGFRALGEWKALASANHFGHAHQRQIRYRAWMEFTPEENSWKLAGLTVLEAQ